MVDSVRVLGFSPATNGLHFANSFPSGTPDYTFSLLGHTVKLGDASNGLCGGFVFTVKDCFATGLLPPADTTAPAGGSDLFNYLVARLTNSFDEPDVNQYLSWIQMNDDDNVIETGLAHHEITEEWPKIKADLDSNQLSTLGLIGAKEPSTVGFVIAMGNGDLGKCHQVLAWGYDLDGSTLTLHIYDPNYPGRDSTISLDIGHPSHTSPLDVSGYPPETYRGFFRTHYSYHDPRTEASGAFIQTVVTSPGIGSAGPVARPWTDATLLSAGGNPLVRFTGSVHDWSATVAAAPADVDKPIEQLRVVIVTGGDDLRGGSDNCDAVVMLSSGATLTIPNINSNQHWNNDETHTAVIPLPPDVTAGSITRFGLHTQFTGGISGDNWNVNSVTLIAALLPAPVVAPQQPIVQNLIDASGNPLVRFTGSVHDWTSGIDTGGHDSLPVESLTLTITTGGDDLRGGSDNATVTLGVNGGTTTLNNINQGSHWNNGETHSIAVAVPQGTTAGQITSFDLHTQFGGGIGGDNWNVNHVVLQALLTPPKVPAVLRAGILRTPASEVLKRK